MNTTIITFEDSIKHKMDYTIREIGSFCTLLLEGNPNIVEALYIDNPVIFEDAEFKVLKKIRNQFITKKFMTKYLGWAFNACVKRKAKYSTKGISHAMRVLWEAERILDKNITSGEIIGPLVFIHEDLKTLQNTSLRDMIMEMKEYVDVSNTSDQDILIVSSALQTIDKVKVLDEKLKHSTIPDDIPQETLTWMNDWLFQTRLKHQ